MKPIVECPECGTTVNVFVNDRCWACGDDLSDAEQGYR